MKTHLNNEGAKARSGKIKSGPALRLCAFVVPLAAAALLCGCKPDEPVKTAAENENEHLQTLLREECTNQVVGITKIMSSYLDYDPKTAVTNWHAGASVEYINHFGGIDRTNLHLVFRLLT